MKIKLDKQFLKVMGIAAACSVAVTAILAILSFISWGCVFAALFLLFMPIAQDAIKFYEKKRCRYLGDFFQYLMEDEEENKSSRSEIDW